MAPHSTMRNRLPWTFGPESFNNSSFKRYLLPIRYHLRITSPRISRNGYGRRHTFLYSELRNALTDRLFSPYSNPRSLPSCCLNLNLKSTTPWERGSRDEQNGRKGLKNRSHRILVYEVGKAYETMGIQRRIYNRRGNYRSYQHSKSISSIVIEFDDVYS